jgi:transcriptional regulator with XRE-family HTH domain
MSNEKRSKSTLAAMKTIAAKKPEIKARSERVAKALKYRLKSMKLSQANLGDAIGVSFQYINKLLSGRMDVVVSDHFPKIVEALGFSPPELHELVTGEQVGNLPNRPSLRTSDPLLGINTPQIVCGIYPKGTKAGDLNAPAPMSTLLAFPPDVLGLTGNADNIIALRDMRRNRSAYLNPQDVVYVNCDQQPEWSPDKPTYALVDVKKTLHIAEILNSSHSHLTVLTLPQTNPVRIERKKCLGTVVARLRLG